jgi:hypothetical protein
MSVRTVGIWLPVSMVARLAVTPRSLVRCSLRQAGQLAHDEDEVAGPER